MHHAPSLSQPLVLEGAREAHHVVIDNYVGGALVVCREQISSQGILQNGSWCSKRYTKS